MREDLREAIEAAACADHEALTPGRLNAGSVPSERRVGRVRNIVRRFLESIPDESLTVIEMRDALDE